MLFHNQKMLVLKTSRLIGALLTVVALGTICQAQTVTPIGGDTIVVESKILREKCRAFIYLPENYRASAERFPVIYVLDGEYYFSFTTEAAALLAQNKLAPSCIVVGIMTNDRQRDFSPPLDANSGQMPDTPSKGGADLFLNYLRDELIPTINNRFRTQPSRVLIGHSTGGLLAYYSLYKTPGLFQAIVSIDGSTWWNKGKVGKELIAYLESHREFTGNIFECRKDVNIPVRFPANAELLAYLDKQRPSGLKYTYLELPNETHGTIVFPGTYYGLKGIFAASDK